MGEEEKPNYSSSDLISLLWRNRRVISLTAAALGTTALAVSFLIPPTYEASASLVPVGTQGQRAELPGLGVNFGGLGALLSGQQSALALYPEIVLSRTVLEGALASKFRTSSSSSDRPLLDLIEPEGEGPRRMEKAVRHLRTCITPKADQQTGVVTISVLTRWPSVSADLANLLSSSLQKYLNESLRLQASRNREFIESRIKEIQEELITAEDALRFFRERNVKPSASPRLALEQARLERSVRELEDVYLTLRRQFELARIDERRDVPLLSTLDPAVAPSTKYSPKRILTLVLGVLAGGVGTCLVVVLRGR